MRGSARAADTRWQQRWLRVGLAQARCALSRTSACPTRALSAPRRPTSARCVGLKPGYGARLPRRWRAIPWLLRQGEALAEYLPWEGKVVYIGDGGNDWCPSLRLRTHDAVLARQDYSLGTLCQQVRLYPTPGRRPWVSLVEMAARAGAVAVEGCRIAGACGPLGHLHGSCRAAACRVLKDLSFAEKQSTPLATDLHGSPPFQRCPLPPTATQHAHTNTPKPIPHAAHACRTAAGTGSDDAVPQRRGGDGQAQVNRLFPQIPLALQHHHVPISGGG